METMEAILSRRSIRKFKPDAIPEDVVKNLLEAAMTAPSAGNQQPWHFIVIQDRKILEGIAQVHPYAQMLKEAPLAIAVCGDMEKQVHEGYWIQDCSAATENLLLAAHDKGLGAVWLGVYPREPRVFAIQQILKLPDFVTCLCLVALGYPAEEKPPAHRYLPERVHKDCW